MVSSASLKQRLHYIQGRINKAAIKVGRNPQNITIIAITKSFPQGIWEKALSANLTTLGESRIQETQKKTEIFQYRNRIELHLIGHLQSNKARKAVELFDVIQTIDSTQIAKRINQICIENSKKQKR